MVDKIISFSEKISRDLSKSAAKEWLLGNGLGGYSSSTIIGLNTRKYHGLLVAPFDPPWKRKLLLSKLEEVIIIDGVKFQLSTNQYPNNIHPEGYKHLMEFNLNPFPTFTYSLPGAKILKTIYMPHNKNAVLIRYKIDKDNEKSSKILIHPLINFRDLDRVRKTDQPEPGFNQQRGRNHIEINESSEDMYFLSMGSDLMDYQESELPEEERWFRNMEYEMERERGFEFREDHYNPGFFEMELQQEESVFNLLAAGGYRGREHFEELSSDNPEEFERLLEEEIERLEGVNKYFLRSVPNERMDNWRNLLRSARSFIANEKLILAGYHWFSVWGRDSLIALPGLTLATGRHKLAKNILLTLAENEKRGLIPNRFSRNRSELNSADASLLFFYALYKYLTYTDDLGIIDELSDKLEKIIESFSEGVERKIKQEEDGLIWTSEGMTWMDARVEGECVTPREGKTVEINALWYNTLKIMNSISRIKGWDKSWSEKANRVKENFQEKFWNSERDCLFDVIGGNQKADEIRPNQIFALSLPFPLFEERKAGKILSAVQKKLLTPYGLRSLEKEDEKYRGTYNGDIRSKDKAYHQGTIWSWLIGPFISAMSRFKEKNGELENMIKPLINEHLTEGGLGTISEIFDGDKPHRPRGCISQAWSVGEVLRCYTEDIRGIEPPFESKYRSGDN